jgi:hypothetical protein
MDWEPDAASPVCRICFRKWGFFTNRRHHCRHCGKLVCKKCSTNREPLPGTLKNVRICDVCYTQSQKYLDEIETARNTSLNALMGSPIITAAAKAAAEEDDGLSVIQRINSINYTNDEEHFLTGNNTPRTTIRESNIVFFIPGQEGYRDSTNTDEGRTNSKGSSRSPNSYDTSTPTTVDSAALTRALGAGTGVGNNSSNSVDGAGGGGGGTGSSGKSSSPTPILVGGPQQRNNNRNRNRSTSGGGSKNSSRNNSKQDPQSISINASTYSQSSTGHEESALKITASATLAPSGASKAGSDQTAQLQAQCTPTKNPSAAIVSASASASTAPVSVSASSGCAIIQSGVKEETTGAEEVATGVAEKGEEEEEEDDDDPDDIPVEKGGRSRRSLLLEEAHLHYSSPNLGAPSSVAATDSATIATNLSIR